MNRNPDSRRKAFILPLLFLMALFFSGSVSAGGSDFREKLGQIKAKNLAYYEFKAATDLIDRVGTAPDFVLDYWSGQDGRRYTAHGLSADERDIFRQCLDDLPETYKNVLKERLIGIFVVEDFLGSGLADYVLDANDKIYSILLFNPTVLRVSLSELVTQKERTCFIFDRPDMSITVNLNNQLPGLLYILLHEATHIVDYINKYTPYVEPDMLKIQGESSGARPFTERLWADYTQLKDNYSFAYKDRITFYGMSQGPKISISEAADAYRAMEGVPVASLYGALNWAEDLAEYMTFLYLTRIKGTDYTITAWDNGKVIYQYRPFENKKVLEREQELPLTFEGGPAAGGMGIKSL
jgi:hypothetical protein